jgi:hypothetical protein
MNDQFLELGSGAYWGMFAMMFFARGMDFLSTWVATPKLVLEGNPIAKRLGWRGGAIVNVIFCAATAVWPFPAIMVSVMSIMVAARNFQSAWMMRSMGEAGYAMWIHERMITAPPALFAGCIIAQSGLTALVGGGLMLSARINSIPFAIGAGIAGYAAAVFIFSFFALWRSRG